MADASKIYIHRWYERGGFFITTHTSGAQIHVHETWSTSSPRRDPEGGQP